MKVLHSAIQITLLLSITVFSSITVEIPKSEIDVRSFNETALFNTDQLSHEPGEPQLPVFTTFILLPPDADLKSVAVSVDGLSEEKILGTYKVSPAPLPMNAKGYSHTPKNKNLRDGIDIDIYEQDAIYPESITEITDCGQMNIFKIVKVKVNLFRYNPIQKDLYRLSSGDLKVSFLKESSYRVMGAGIASADTKKRLKKLVTNYDEFINDYEQMYNFTRGENLTILITSSTQAKLSKLDAFVAAKKEIAGFNVDVVNEDAWGGGVGPAAYNNIRSWLQDNINVKGLSYILIIGESDPNTSEVPMLYFPNYASWGMGAQFDDCESDWGYSQLTGDYKNDYIPELHVGRIPVYNNYNQIDDILQKTIDYFSASPDDAAWRYNALFGGPGYDAQNVSWKALNSAYNKFIATQPAWEAFRCYSSMYATPQQADIVSNDITNSWAAGSYGLVSWGAHGSATSAQGAFNSSGTSAVGNDYPSYVMCGSCSNATITTSDNLSYSILKNCGMGAIGGTEFTVIAGDMVWIESFVGYLAMDSLTIGATHTELLINDCLFPWLNRGPYVLYGDPSIGIYSYQKEPFVSVSTPDSLEQNSSYNLKWSDNIESNFKIELMKNGSSIEVLNESTAEAFDWLVTESYSVGSNYQFKVTCIDSTKYTALSNEFTIIPEYIIKDFPYIENLDNEQLPYKYEQSRGDDIDWTLLSGATPSKTGAEPNKTGPDADHTTGTDGNYLYIEASDPNNPGKEATLITPKFGLSDLGNPTLSFWVHMFSANNEMGELCLDINRGRSWENGVQTLTDDHGDEWFKVEQDLSNFTGDRVQFRFRGTTGSTWCSDICIDDIKVDGSVPVVLQKMNLLPTSFGIRSGIGKVFYQIPQSVKNKEIVTIKLFNLQGKLVHTLFNDHQKAGYYSVPLLKELSSGIYLCQMKCGNYKDAIKVSIKK